MPLVSVILTSYNHAKYIKKAIDSVLEQTFDDFELIIWDDASSDNSWEIINSYHDNRIRKFRNEHQMRAIFGINEAISNVATGEYIAIHHSDDVWAPEKLEKQVKQFNLHQDCGAVFTWAQIIDERGAVMPNHFLNATFSQPNRTRHDWLNIMFFGGNFFCHPSALIRKGCFDLVGKYNNGLAQLVDMDMWVRILLQYDVIVIDEKLTKMRILDGEKNAGAIRIDSIARDKFESFMILSNYLAINKVQEVMKIFPFLSATIPNQGEIGDDLASFLIGLVAVQRGNKPQLHLFGAQILTNTVKNPQLLEKANKAIGFNKQYYADIVGRTQIFC